MRILYQAALEDQEVTVCDVKSLFGEEGDFRILQFSDEAAQGAIDRTDPKRILFEYPRAILHLMELNDREYEDVFVIGHGIGTLAGSIPGKRVKVAEISSEIVEISRTYFGYDQDNVRIGDGRELLEEEPREAFDYIVVDAFTEQGTPPHLTSLEFFQLSKERLDHEGAVILNLIGKHGNDRRLNAIHTTLSAVYPYTKAFSLPSNKASDIQNLIIMGRNIPIAYQERNMAGFIETRLGEGHLISDRK